MWNAWAKKNHYELWQRGIELAKQSDAFKRLKQEAQKKGSVYNGMTDDQLADEVLADAIGKKGQGMYNEKDWTHTARVKHWLTQLWHRIGEALGFRKRMPNMAVGDMSFDDIVRTAAGDILSGKRLKGAKGHTKGVEFQAGNKGNQTRTANFKRWFGDWENDPENASKVEDENGRPLVVYHGTKLQEYYWKDGHPYTRNTPKFFTFNSGFFTSDRDAAKEFADGNESKVYEVFLDIKKPLEIDANGANFDAIELPDGRVVSTVRLSRRLSKAGNMMVLSSAM